MTGPSTFVPGWPIDEQKYLRLLRRMARFRGEDYTIQFRAAAGGIWTHAEALKLRPELFNMTLGGTAQDQLRCLATLIDTQPEEVAVMCVYIGYCRKAQLDGYMAHSVVKVLEHAHQVAAEVLDIRTRLVGEALANEIEYSGDFEFPTKEGTHD